MSSSKNVDQNPNRLVGAAEVCCLLDVSRAGLWRLMQRPNFPKALRYDPTSARSHLKWFAQEICAFAAEQRALTIAAAEAGTESLGIQTAR
jgi:predicted DNA-binding transcriptional regulator AlpA